MEPHARLDEEDRDLILHVPARVALTGPVIRVPVCPRSSDSDPTTPVASCDMPLAAVYGTHAEAHSLRSEPRTCVVFPLSRGLFMFSTRRTFVAA